MGCLHRILKKVRPNKCPGEHRPEYFRSQVRLFYVESSVCRGGLKPMGQVIFSGLCLGEALPGKLRIPN